jgi:hypothetical protein
LGYANICLASLRNNTCFDDRAQSAIETRARRMAGVDKRWR